MTLYILVFIVAVFYFLCCRGENARKNPFLFALFFFYLAIFVGLGDMQGGYDRYIYGEIFDKIADSLRENGDVGDLTYFIQGQEWGYYLLNVLVAHFTTNRYVFIFVTSLLIYTLFFLSIRNTVKDYPFACLIFLGFFYYFSMTYLRQCLACGVVWFGMKYAWERKPFHYFLIVLLAYSFHNSAIIAILFYFIPLKKYSKRVIVIFLFICLLISLTPLTIWLVAIQGGDRFASNADSLQGFRLEYILEVVFIVGMIFYVYDSLPSDRRTLVLLNVLWGFCGILLLFMRFGQGGRIGWYCILAVIYLFTKISQIYKVRTVYNFVTLSLCCWLFMRITVSWSFNLAPYKTFLSNGIPSGEIWIYEKYEYDRNYTNDKMYRKIFDPVF